MLNLDLGYCIQFLRPKPDPVQSHEITGSETYGRTGGFPSN